MIIGKTRTNQPVESVEGVSLGTKLYKHTLGLYEGATAIAISLSPIPYTTDHYIGDVFFDVNVIQLSFNDIRIIDVDDTMLYSFQVGEITSTDIGDGQLISDSVEEL